VLVQMEVAEAVKWYRLAAAQGQVDVQCKLGLMYEWCWKTKGMVCWKTSPKQHNDSSWLQTKGMVC
jgi:hypothetical protein